ncbi:MAG: OmpA family protein [Candidatus Hinthialibacter antarcticus]|nr:OmpA family protein [Candidatus Hinthialibacter antarcticus]
MTNRKSLLSVLVLTLAIAVTAGCACKAPNQGAHAFAQKGGESVTEEPDWNRVAGQELPLDQIPGFAESGMCARVHFDYDKSNVKPEWTDCLDKIAAFFTQHPQYTLIIEGHCDERGSNEYNMALGERRATSTAEYLIQRGLNAQRMNTRSMGEEQALASCHNESCWWQNRRCDFYFVEKAR